MPDENAYPQFQPHGAVVGVTGSCHSYIADDSHHLLIDCGLFHGEDDIRDTTSVGGSEGHWIRWSCARLLY